MNEVLLCTVNQKHHLFALARKEKKNLAGCEPVEGFWVGLDVRFGNRADGFSRTCCWVGSTSLHLALFLLPIEKQNSFFR